MSRKPDFFIVGAPKCGTTAMADYLSRHPEVFMPTRKELHVFGSDLVFARARRSEARYLECFAGATGERRVGEASVWYLSSARAAAEIHAFSPTARIIAMLRNPVDMMHSLHSQRVYNGTEDILDFEAALAAEPDRRRGQRLPRNTDNIMGCFYRDAARHAGQVRRYFEVFGRDRVHVIVFDDVRADLARVYRDTCAFLDVDARFEPAFGVVNANKRVRSERLRDIVRFASPQFRAVVRAFVRSAPLRQRVKRRLKTVNTAYRARPPLDPALRRRLQAEFVGEVERLSALLGRDLSAWCVE